MSTFDNADETRGIDIPEVVALSPHLHESTVKGQWLSLAGDQLHPIEKRLEVSTCREI